MTTFGKRFKELRIERGLTQEQIAEHFLTDKSGISKYEHDKGFPNNIEEYADFFGVTVDYLMARTDDRENKIIEYKTKESFVNELLTLLVKQGKIEKFSDLTENQRKMIEAAISQQIEEINKSRG